MQYAPCRRLVQLLDGSERFGFQLIQRRLFVVDNLADGFQLLFERFLDSSIVRFPFEILPHSFLGALLMWHRFSFVKTMNFAIFRLYWNYQSISRREKAATRNRAKSFFSLAFAVYFFLRRLLVIFWQWLLYPPKPGFRKEAFREENRCVADPFDTGQRHLRFRGDRFASKISADESLANNEPYFAWSGWFILFAMVFDMLDGYVARLSKTASDFGGELDSLCDVVSFGVTPAFLLLKLGPGWEPNQFLHQLLAGIAALYFCCTALRLARFNVENAPDPTSHKRLRGLPSPGAAGCVAAFAILRGEFPTTLATRLQTIDLETARTQIAPPSRSCRRSVRLVVALLMVSQVPYPHLTGKILPRQEKYRSSDPGPVGRLHSLDVSLARSVAGVLGLHACLSAIGNLAGAQPSRRIGRSQSGRGRVGLAA